MRRSIGFVLGIVFGFSLCLLISMGLGGGGHGIDCPGMVIAAPLSLLPGGDETLLLALVFWLLVAVLAAHGQKTAFLIAEAIHVITSAYLVITNARDDVHVFSAHPNDWWPFTVGLLLWASLYLTLQYVMIRAVRRGMILDNH